MVEKKESSDLTHGPLAKQILFFSLPLMLSQLLEVLFNLSDVAVAGKFADYKALGAVGSTTLLVSLFTGFLIGMGSGVNVCVAHRLGAGSEKGAAVTIHSSFVICTVTGLVLGAALFFCGPAFLALFTTEAAVIDAGMKRVAVMAFAYCVSAFMDCTIAASRGLGKTVVPTVIVVLGSCVFRVIWVYTIFAHFHTIPSLYLLYPCSWTLTAIAELVYFIHAYKDSMKIFTQPQPAEV